MRRLLLILFSASFAIAGWAQQDSTKKAPKNNGPRKAAILSACLPGLGQGYNKKYWKIPVIYGAFAVPVYFITYTNKQFKDYRDAYIDRTDGDPNTVDIFPEYSDDQLKENVDFYRRYRDMNIFFCGLVYALNILDANVDAHLKTFDVKNNISFKVTAPANTTSLCFVLKF
jgi:hypothetical protein